MFRLELRMCTCKRAKSKRKKNEMNLRNVGGGGLFIMRFRNGLGTRTVGGNTNSIHL
jgi:hypothetical protein